MSERAYFSVSKKSRPGSSITSTRPRDNLGLNPSPDLLSLVRSTSKPRLLGARRGNSSLCTPHLLRMLGLTVSFQTRSAKGRLAMRAIYKTYPAVTRPNASSIHQASQVVQYWPWQSFTAVTCPSQRTNSSSFSSDQNGAEPRRSARSATALGR